MPVTAKICGISSFDALDAAIGGGASHVGFVFYSPSPRYVPYNLVSSLADVVPPTVKRVGVFVDPMDCDLDWGLSQGRLHAIQVHKTAPDRVAQIRRNFRVETWAAVAVKTRADLATAASYRGAADRILYDAKTPDGATLPGGMGIRFDWQLLAGFDHPLPWALSGGLDAGNVADAVGITGARLVDVSSGVESAPGVKDVDKLAAFLQATARL